MSSGTSSASPTLRRRLSTLLLRWLLVYLIVAAVISVLAFAQARSEAVEERLLLARTVAHYLDASITTAHRNLGALAVQLPALDESAVPRLRAHRFQAMFRDAIFILDADGNPLVADPGYVDPPPPHLLAERPRVTALLAAGHGSQPSVAVVEPFRRDGRRYYLAAVLRPLGSTVSGFLQDLGLGRDFHLAVVDDGGRVLAAADQKRLYARVPERAELGAAIAAGEPWVATTPGCVLCDEDPHDGGPFLSVLVPLQQAPWGVLVQQSRARAFSSLRAVQIAVLGTGLLLGLMGVFLFRALSRSVVEPIGELSTQAEELWRGNLEAPIAVSGDREIEVLASTLEAARSRLASTLGQLTALNETLEQQVSERTRALRVRDAQRRTLVRRLMAAAEEERRRIARELHDETSQLLTVIQLSLERLPETGGELPKARNLLTKAQKEIHRVIYDLRPSLLDDLGLAAAVKWYARNDLEAAGLDVRLEVEEDLELPPTVETTAFRIYQEIVTNILRHAGAETVSVELYVDQCHGQRHGQRHEEGRVLVLGVEDDGVGFDPSAVAGERAGIVGMGERAELVGGRLTLDSEPGLGTHVRVEIPLDDWEEA